MMKKITFMILALTVLTNANVNAQSAQDCGVLYNLFKGDVQSKKYDQAYPQLLELMKSCPTLSKNIYIYGERLAMARFDAATDKSAASALVTQVYKLRLINFPKEDPAKVHNNYASFLAENKLASNDEVFALLEKAYSIDPSRLSPKNIYKFFQGVTDRNKDTNPQKVFDTYDDVVESVQEKLDDYSKKLAKINAKVDKGETLDKREERNLRAYTINSKALGTIEGSLDAIIVELSTCARLIPLYTKEFESKKTDPVWLKRAVSRMYAKECTDDPLYEKLVEAYVAADPSPEASVFFAGILYLKGKESEAMDYYKKAVDQETDPFKKAKSLYKIAQLFSKKGQKSKSRDYARQALKYNPNMGNAYLLIAGLYGTSIDDCGSNEFEKRMVYTAALDKAKKAVAVDPSISSKAFRYIKNYREHEPDKKLIFNMGLKSGDSFTVKCWINETVKIPKK